MLRFDFNGHDHSEGQFKDMTVLNDIQDLKCVVSWVQKQSWVKSINLLGHSQGEVVVSMTAGDLGKKVIKNIVLMAPAAMLRDDALRGDIMGNTYDPWALKEDIPLWGCVQQLGVSYKTAQTLPIYETSLKYSGKALLVHGIHDRVVPYTYSDHYHQGYKNSDIHPIDGDDHAFGKETAATAKYVAEWLIQNY